MEGEAVAWMNYFFLILAKRYVTYIGMLESEKFLSLQRMLTEDTAIKKVLHTAQTVASKYVELGQKTVIFEEDLRLLSDEIN